jgi:hypothetical protein
MEKIISVFARNYDGDRLVRPEIVPGAEWAAAGEGTPTRKFDGTCCRIDEYGALWKRYDAKKGKTPPAGFSPAQPEPDPVSGHWPGWILVGEGPEDRWHIEALGNLPFPPIERPGTYELVGPKVQGNPERAATHVLLKHGADVLVDVPTPAGLSVEEYFRAIRLYLAEHDIEGIVWHHPDGRTAKIKGKDFGLKRGAAVGV